MVNSELHASADLPLESTSHTHSTGGSVGPRAGLEALVAREVPCFCWESNRDMSVWQFVVWSLCQLSCPGLVILILLLNRLILIARKCRFCSRQISWAWRQQLASLLCLLLLTCKHNFCICTRCSSSPTLTNSSGSLVIAIKPEDTTVFRPAAVLLF